MKNTIKTKNTTNMDMNTIVPNVAKGGVIIVSGMFGFVVNKSLRKADIPMCVTVPLSIFASLGLASFGCRIVDVVGSAVRIKSGNLIPSDLGIINSVINEDTIRKYCKNHNIDLRKSVVDIDPDDLINFYIDQTNNMCEQFLMPKLEEPPIMVEADIITDVIEVLYEQIEDDDPKAEEEKLDALTALTEKTKIVDPDSEQSKV